MYKRQALDSVGKAGSVPGTDGEPDPSDNSREAQLLRRWYPEVVGVIQEGAWWSTSRAIATLDDEEEEEDEYTRSFALPEGFLRARYLKSGFPFLITDRFLTDDPEPWLVYSVQQEDPTTWGASQFRATSFGLASKIARPLTGHSDLARTLEGQANYYLLEARAVEGNKQNNQFDSVPEWIAARQNGLQQQRVRYFYPFGALFHSFTPIGYERTGAEQARRAPIFG